MDEKARLRSVTRITVIGAAINLVLAVVKMVVGRTSHSQALFADGVHSLSDLITDIFVLITSRFGSKAADEAHPYGHGRIETVGSIMVAILLIVAGGVIAWEALDTFMATGPVVMPGKWALVIACISIVSKEWLYHATLRVAKQWRSAVVTANAWHHRSDAASSLVVVLGLLGSYLGYPLFDAFAAIIVGLKIIHMGAKLVWQGLRELIDTGLDDDTLAQIEKHIQTIPGVIAVHQLRSRLLGGAVFIDVHVLVSHRLSVSEGHHIGERVQQQLLEKFDKIEDVTVHVDPEDDEVTAPSAHLPLREEILAICNKRWSALEASDRIDHVVLHYLSGEIYLEVWFSLQDFDDIQRMASLADDYRFAVKDVSMIRSVKILFHQGGEIGHG